MIAPSHRATRSVGAVVHSGVGMISLYQAPDHGRSRDYRKDGVSSSVKSFRDCGVQSGWNRITAPIYPSTPSTGYKVCSKLKSACASRKTVNGIMTCQGSRIRNAKSCVRVAPVLIWCGVASVRCGARSRATASVSDSKILAPSRHI